MIQKVPLKWWTKYADFILLRSANSDRVDKIGMANANFNTHQGAKKRTARTGNNVKKCTQPLSVNFMWMENALEKTASSSIPLSKVAAAVTVPMVAVVAVMAVVKAPRTVAAVETIKDWMKWKLPYQVSW